MHKKITILLTILCLTISGLAATTSQKPSPFPVTTAPQVVIIPVSGTVNAAMSAFIGRAIKTNADQKNRIIVLEIDTYGGEVDAAFNIVDTMLSLKNTATIAYVKTKAISAGTLIGLSCQRLYMKHNTTLGDVAPLMVSNEGPKMLGEKFQSPIRAKFRTLAKRNGYPERLTEAMVTMGAPVFEIKLPDTTMYLDSIGLAALPAGEQKRIVSRRTVVKTGELLTMDDVEAKTLSFSRKSVADEQEMLKDLGYTAPVITRIERNWSEELVRILAILAPYLMTIGIGLLYIEFKSPGFGLPGIVGIILIAIVFLGQYAVGLANYTEILLAVLGISLIVVEIFVFPTGGMLALGGGALLLVAMVLSFQGFVIPKPEFPWQTRTLLTNLVKVLVSFVAAGGISFLFIKFGLPRLGAVVQGPYLNDTLSNMTATSGLSIPVSVGDRGVVITALRPAGRARFNNEDLDVVSNGEFIEKGNSVTVAHLQGNRIVVIPEHTA